MSEYGNCNNKKSDFQFFLSLEKLMLSEGNRLHVLITIRVKSTY